MVYVMADIHGNAKGFSEMLKKINFGKDDILYIAGDLVDYGEEGMELLTDISMRDNVFAVVGEHDFKALRMLTKFDTLLRENKTPDASFIAEMKEWMEEGGAPTLAGFRELDPDMREGILDYLADLSIYEEVTVRNEEYLIVHAGLKNFTPGLDPDSLSPEDVTSEPLDPEKEYFEDKTVIVGHVRTNDFPDADNDMIYYGEGSVFLDCGSSMGGRLACLCLDTGKEYYVS